MDMSSEKSDPTAMLETMDLEGLRELRKNLDRAISSYETRKRQGALSAVEQAAREHGFKLADLLREGKSGKGRKSAGDKTDRSAKYVNPEDPEQTWSGRGRRPQWVNNVLETGRTLDELLA